jgi:hypothetical protein
MSNKNISFKPSLFIDENLSPVQLKLALDPFFCVTTVHQSNLKGAPDRVLWDHIMKLNPKPDFILTADKRYKEHSDLTYLMYEHFFGCFENTSSFDQAAQEIANIPLFIYVDRQKINYKSPYDSLVANLVANQGYLMGLKQYKVSPVVFLNKFKISVNTGHFTGKLNADHFLKKNVIMEHMEYILNLNIQELKKINKEMCMEFNHAALYTPKYVSLMPLVDRNEGIHVKNITPRNLHFQPYQPFRSVS